jgi:OmcA/MtrC family decaheme c-type cytochrome
MKKCLAFAGVVLALAPAVFLNTAVAQVRPVNKTVASQAKKPVDFHANINGTTNSLGKTGVTVKIQSAAIAKDGTITVRATIVDSNGIPLDRLGVATDGPVSMSFIADYIPAGQTQYVSYTTSVSKATLNLTNPSQVQAANDSGGTFTTNGIGDYTYTFKTKAPVTFDATVTNAVGVSVQRDLSKFGTFDEWSETSNDVFNFVPNGSVVKTTRSVVTTDACNQCHNPLIGHGGSRIKVELCIMCHTPQTINADTGLTQDMKVLIHKIHMGSSLPSVIAGTPYRIWHRGAWSDFSAVVFPQDVRNCTTCHTAAATQNTAWKTNPSAAVCGSCHDDVNFATGQNHVNLPQVDDKQCAGCHGSTQYTDFDATIPGAHLIPQNSATLPGIVTKVIGVTGATPGNAPTVNFSVQNKAGGAVDITKLSSFRIVMAGTNVDYGVAINGMARVSESPAATATGSNGVYTYTMTNKIPTVGIGSFTISIEASNTVTLLPGTTKATTAVDAAIPVEYYFSVDKSAVVARRQVVDTAKCASCHANLGFVHGGTRANTQECTICHNPTLTDGTSKQSVSMATQIHSIHRGENLANPYVLGTTNYQDVKFPGDLRDCTTCHNPGTYMVENVGAKAAVASPGGFTPTTPPIAAACQGCHDDVDTASHALANTTILGESCKACHSAGEQFSVDRVHQRIF